ncbi:transposase [Falsiroseomonas oryzae]|uniref:transposase n=1 Tax=Falsiroseomonas oryzae TaxID=2766473 RepID=UPI0022EA109A|nr:transposase [Roseomonas sp. MO-31]
MPPPPPAFPLRRSTPRPWRPLTDAEWQALSAILHRSGRGRPPRDARRCWDGIFWIACSKLPWRALPPAFGRADSAHRALRRAAAAHHLHRMLLRVSDHPGFAGDALQPIEWFIVRAWRRAFRITPGAIAFARRLGLASALPAEPFWLPQPDLSEAVAAIARKAAKWAGGLPLEFLQALHFLMRRAGGEPRMWRTTG